MEVLNNVLIFFGGVAAGFFVTALVMVAADARDIRPVVEDDNEYR